MKKSITAVALSVPLLLLTGCTFNSAGVNRVVYNPGFSNDYVYSVGYYNNRPFWGNNYYYIDTPGYNYGYGLDGYWGGGYYNGY